MKKILLFTLIAVLLMSFAACTQTETVTPTEPGTPEVTPAEATEIKSEKPRVTMPEIAKTDLAALVNGNSAFALDLYQVLKDEDGNLFYSPYSISAALAMT